MLFDFEKEIIDDLINKLDDYKGTTNYGCDLAYTLFEGYNVDGSVTYSTYDAREWIKKHFSDLGDVVENMKFNGLDVANVFDEPEKFMVQVYLETASSVLSRCEFIDDYWNDKFELDETNIVNIKTQLEALKND